MKKNKDFSKLSLVLDYFVIIYLVINKFYRLCSWNNENEILYMKFSDDLFGD